MHVDDLREASRERLLAEIGALQHQFNIGYANQIEVLTARNKDLEMALLKSRDHSRGLSAQLGELISINEKLTLLVNQQRKAYDRILNSNTWKLVRISLIPVRLLKRFIKAG